MAAKAGVPLLASVPLDPMIVEAGDTGRPYVYHQSESAAAQELAKALGPILDLEEDSTGRLAVTAADAGSSLAVSAGSASDADELVVSSATEAEADSVLRFAIPTSDGLLCSHFGHCQEFTLIDIEPPSRRVVGTTTVPAPEHEPGLLPTWLAEQGAGFVIAGGMGSRAQQLFTEQGVTVVTGAPVAEPETIVQRYLAGSLVTGENVCDH